MSPAYNYTEQLCDSSRQLFIIQVGLTMGNCLTDPELPLVITPLNPCDYPSNKVSTTNYSIYSFVPLALALQFNRLANIYFLVTAIIQSIPIISPLPWYTAVLPLLLVLVVSLLRQGTEEYYKYKCDRESNNTIHDVWSKEHGDWRLFRAQDLKLGMVVKIKDNQISPADLLLLQTHKPQGLMHLQTSSLDGEKALKTKNSLKQTQNMLIDDLQDLTVKVSPPMASLYKFEALITLGSKQKVAGIKNFVYRGSKPKNSVEIVGLVVYVGQFTKIMKNCGDSQTKMSFIERRVNVLMIFIFMIQTCLILLMVGLRTYWLVNFANDLIGYYITPITAEVLLTFSNYFILLNTMIPISLIVSIELVKSIQGYFITEDRLMTAQLEDDTIRTPKAFRSSLNQELGMVQYVFTDKTGTLTRNQMVMKNLVIGTQLYRSQHPKMFVCPQLEKQDLQSQPKLKASIPICPSYTITKQTELIQMFLLTISVCHQCVLSITSTPQDPVYQGSSPDEIALLNTAKALGWIYQGTHLEKITLRIPTGARLKHLKLLQVFQFDSDRKRMSVIVECHYGIILCCKGADNIIKGLLKPGQPNVDSVTSYINQFSVKGLRTLLIACRYIKKEDYDAFVVKTQGLMEKDKEVKDSHIKQLEQNLVLLGATAVQDRLQANVPQTIKDLLLANIKVCMLTGDKLQTAENIAKSCNLISPQTEVAVIREEGTIGDLALAYRRTGRWKSQNKKVSVIVEGAALADIINHQMFYCLVEAADSMICCRVTPKDKASVVKLVKEKLKKIVLSIGDGANDVEMIHEAHIGIGLYGNEGMNAVQASDYALPEFQGLWRLLFIHGRWNYLRITGLIKYFFFKNMVFTFPQFLYAFSCGFSGASIYNGIYLTLFNTVFTALPLVVRALFQQDMNYLTLVDSESNPLEPKQDVKQDIQHGLKQQLIEGVQIDPTVKQLIPSLYIVGQSNLLFGINQFLLINLQAVVCACLIYYITSLTDVSISFTQYSIIIYTAVLFLVTFKLCADIQYWTWLLLFTILFTSLVPYILFVYVSSLFTIFAVNGNFGQVFTSINFYLVVMMTSFVSIMVTTVIDILRVYFWPSMLDRARGELREKKRLRDNSVARKYNDYFQMEMTTISPTKLQS